MSNEELTSSNPKEQDTERAELAPTPPSWIQEHSFPVIVGCAALLGAIVVGCNVLLGSAIGEHCPSEHLQ